MLFSDQSFPSHNRHFSRRWNQPIACLVRHALNRLAASPNVTGEKLILPGGGVLRITAADAAAWKIRQAKRGSRG